MRIAFMGSPPFAAHVLKTLVEAAYPIVAVYTQPPRPMGRGYKLTPTPVHDLALTYKIPLFTPPSLKSKEEQDRWHDLHLDLAIVVAYGLILPRPIFEGPRLGCLNVHPSLLPRWRGSAPIQRTILAGDTETGVTIMKINEELDAGDVLLEERVPLDNTETTEDLFELLAEVGAKALIKAIGPYAEGKLIPVPQPLDGITYAEKLTKPEGKLDWTLPAEILDRKVRALNPWPGTWFQVGEDAVKVLEAQVVEGEAPPGTLLGHGLTIACGTGALRLLKVQKLGKNPLPAAEFVRGYSLPSRLSP